MAFPKAISRGSRLLRRQTSTPHYQTFNTPPPRSRGKPPSASSNSSAAGASSPESQENGHIASPLPKRQMFILAVISLCEQTALNSISPYLPQMASSFPEVQPGEVGVYVGTIASSFALAQFATNFFWGWLSDRIGRKPVILIGTLLTAACFVAFGFCRTLWQAVVVQAAMGLFNGNQAVVSTCLGEITDRSNQSKAFTYLPIIYGLGGITGPILGGLLISAGDASNPIDTKTYPYLGPNLAAAAILTVDFLLATIFLEESLEARDLPPLGDRVRNIFTWIWQFSSSSTRPTYLREGGKQVASPELSVQGQNEEIEDDDENESVDDHTLLGSTPALTSRGGEELTRGDVLNRDTLLLLITYLIFQLSNISFNSLYPIFASSPVPTGRALSPSAIGLSLAFAGGVTILFQVGIFGALRTKLGNRVTYRAGLAGFVAAFLLMPWVGYKDGGQSGGLGLPSGKVWMWIEMGLVLFIKTVAAVGGLTSALLLITNSAPNHAVLGTLNGLAQTLSAAGRAAGPFLSGGLFTIATRVRPKGEALAFGVFGGISFIGFLLSFGIRSEDLEDESWEEDHSSDKSDEDDA